ncbi:MULTISPECIES: hypothetical protein [unclassified Paenibacillus]|uniref:hypothetical protein n=1 Tax=unclassified Paenibacillus TaxID=185978 RepID=UPI0027862E5C|nr:MULTISPECIES: hypothetical protein [unclassified Paenibacillus]MDQ0896278.1 hypothetical protein [Paenibacillus sp. V4I7]MDQ0913794.1 hypothetical protein [Paenibacillus sp. V4I5]
MDLGMHWTIGRAKEHLEKEEGISIPAQTLRNWFNELHESKVHTLKRNQRGERVLDETDIAIAKYIHAAREKSLSVKALVPFIQQSFPVQYVSEDDEQKLSVYLDQEVVVEQLGLMMEERLLRFKEEMEAKQKLMLPAPNVVIAEQRSAAVDVRLAELSMRKRLRDQAEKEWTKNPVKKWFREDKEQKAKFIEDYVESHLEVELINYKKEIQAAITQVSTVLEE